MWQFHSYTLPFVLCFLSAFLECLYTVKSMISQSSPDVCLQVELCLKHLAKEKTEASLSFLPVSLLTLKHTPDTPRAHQQPHSTAPCCKFPSLSFLSSRRPFGPDPSHAAPPLRVLLVVGLPYWMPAFLFDPILHFKGRHLIHTLGEVGEVGGGGHVEGQWAGSTMFVIDGYRQNPGPLSLPFFPLSVCLSPSWGSCFSGQVKMDG